MIKVVKEVEVPSPKISEATLLSAEEWKNLSPNVRVEEVPEALPLSGLRPVLKLESPVLSSEYTVKPGDVLKIGAFTFTALSPTLLLADRPLSRYYASHELRCCHIFDEYNNTYANSSARECVDTWFERWIKPYLD